MAIFVLAQSSSKKPSPNGNASTRCSLRVPPSINVTGHFAGTSSAEGLNGATIGRSQVFGQQRRLTTHRRQHSGAGGGNYARTLPQPGGRTILCYKTRRVPALDLKLEIPRGAYVPFSLFPRFAGRFQRKFSKTLAEGPTIPWAILI